MTDGFYARRMDVDVTTTTPPPALRWGFIILGAITAVLGLVIVLNPFTTAQVLAILVGIELILIGILDLIDHRAGNQKPSLAAGIVSILAGLAVCVWPDVTLKVIAFIVGIGFVIRGVILLVAAFTPEAKAKGGRGLLIFVGGLSSVVGIAAMVWPKATIVVLAVLFGIQMIIVGVMALLGGIALGKAEIVEVTAS